MNALLYLSTVLIWGTTWIAIKVQLGPVPIPLSIAYRFFLAAAALFAILAWRGQLRRPRGTALGLIAAQGLTLFCFNFLCFYYASHYLPSGLVAVVFSTATLWNALNARLILKRRIAPPGDGGRRAGAGRHRHPVLAATGPATAPTVAPCSGWGYRSWAPCASPPATCCRPGCRRSATRRCRPMPGPC